ncbi:NAD(P)-binding protein [Morchella conica CCBAS932]|uniref:NAD(P)-binding protein n=1 Tax=Morchella conica CCBAS932 TaxID=1392247 RepID=A0A3N4KMM0_9PEZI|nr:NAD(P)-binding protein [Morchella conica CCBAS932]
MSSTLAQLEVMTEASPNLSLPLTGKIALITGASKGIGASIATKLHSQGATVIINYSRDPTPAAALVAQLGPFRSHHIKADVSSVTECKRLVDETVSRYGRIDILVLNAGVLPNRDLAATTEDEFDGTFAVNVKGPYFITQAAAPHIPSGGRVVFFSTSLTAATTVTPNYLLYIATKGAVEQMTRVLAKDLGRRGICVNCVSPGPTGTDLFYNGKPQAVVDMIAGWNPMGRIGTPEEVANVVRFLAGHESAWVNGQNMRVNGGMA